MAMRMKPWDGERTGRGRAATDAGSPASAGLPVLATPLSNPKTPQIQGASHPAPNTVNPNARLDLAPRANRRRDDGAQASQGLRARQSRALPASSRTFFDSPGWATMRSSWARISAPSAGT
jgi:hypothetical protein